VRPLVHFLPDPLTYPVPLFLEGQCDRTPGLRCSTRAAFRLSPETGAHLRSSVAVGSVLGARWPPRAASIYSDRTRLKPTTQISKRMSTRNHRGSHKYTAVADCTRGVASTPRLVESERGDSNSHRKAGVSYQVKTQVFSNPHPDFYRIIRYIFDTIRQDMIE
jgi:hypothetical protein